MANDNNFKGGSPWGTPPGGGNGSGRGGQRPPNIDEVVKKIQNSEIVVGNESGPICLGLSYNKRVLILYSPLHTAPESKMIGNKSKYYNTAKLSLKKFL